jgi:NAD(P)-dependent dehydrogenase (short-subunit alcohol dehydrogenase family)
MSFQNQVVVIPGATGVVGSGAARAFLKQGATVVAVSRSGAKLDALKAQLGGGDAFKAVVGDFGTEASAAAAHAAVMAAVGGKPVDHVVSVVGFVTIDKAPTATSLDTFRRALDDGLFNNFLVARSFLPALKGREGSSFTMVSGGLAHYPPADATLWLGTVKNASVNALTFALASETMKDKVRVNTFCIHFSVAPVGGEKNQFGMPAEGNTDKLAPAFLGLAKGTSKGQLICLNAWADVERWAK